MLVKAARWLSVWGPIAMLLPVAAMMWGLGVKSPDAVITASLVLWPMALIWMAAVFVSDFSEDD